MQDLPFSRFVSVSTEAKGAAPGLKSVNLDLCSGQILGLAGVSGNGQAGIADLVSGLALPKSGEILVHGKPMPDWSPRAAITSGIARGFLKTGTRPGTIANFSLTENALLERYFGNGFFQKGLAKLEGCGSFRYRYHCKV